MFDINKEKNKSSVILNPERSEWVSRSHVTGVEPVVNDGAKTKRYSAKRDLYGPSLRSTLKMTALAFLLSLNLSESWAVTCNFTPDPNNAGKYSLEVKGDSGGNVFSGCNNGFPDGISEWSQARSKITSATLDKNITSIGAMAFVVASSLESITIPDSVTSIGWSAFHGASKLTSITIPDSVTSIGVTAFEKTGLTSITIPDSVTSIGQGAFRDAKSLTSITIPDSVTSIGANAFRGASSLESITIPDSVTSIGADAFKSVKEIIISDKLDMSGWNSGALSDDSDGTVTFKCKGNQEICKEKIAEFAARASNISGNNIIFDAGDHRECFRTSKDEENVSYYHTGTECAELPESGNITCASGYADYNGNCYAQLPFSKKRWTPAEANEWLHDGNDNFVVITFKK